MDDRRRLAGLLRGLGQLAESYELEWPVHPRTQARIHEFGLQCPNKLRILPPASRTAFLDRLERAQLVVTDSGGVQEEAAILGIPCVTVRRHTERPEALHARLGVLSNPDPKSLVLAARELLSAEPESVRPMPELYGDGTAGDKIARACAEWLCGCTEQRPGARSRLRGAA